MSQHVHQDNSTAQLGVQFDFLTEKSNSLLKTIPFFRNCIHESLAPLTRWKISKSGLVNNSQLPTGNCSNFFQGFLACASQNWWACSQTLSFTVRHMACFVSVSSFDIVSLAPLNVLSVSFEEEEDFLVKVHRVHFRKFFLVMEALREITRCTICFGSSNEWLHFWGTSSEESR